MILRRPLKIDNHLIYREIGMIPMERVLRSGIDQSPPAASCYGCHGSHTSRLVSVKGFEEQDQMTCRWAKLEHS